MLSNKTNIFCARYIYRTRYGITHYFFRRCLFLGWLVWNVELTRKIMLIHYRELLRHSIHNPSVLLKLRVFERLRYTSTVGRAGQRARNQLVALPNKTRTL